MSAHPLFLIVVFDGLRPDMVTPDIMPHLSRFMANGTNFTNARTVFPSSTRPAAAALATGSTPRRNGIVHNKFFDPNVFDDRMFQPNQVSDIEAGMSAYGGDLLTTPSLGDLTAEADYTMAVLLSGSSGTARLINPRAADRGHISMGFRNWKDSCPTDAVRKLVASHGPVAVSARPDINAIRMQTDMVLESVYPRYQPDIMVSWYSDPDQTHHYHGVDSAEMDTALDHVDGQFGRMIDWWQASNLKDRLQIIAISDHGHLTTRHRIDVNGEAAKAGFKIDDHFKDGADYAGYTSYCGSLRIRDRDLGRISAMVEWLFEQPWCGIICTLGGDGIEGCVPGTFDHALALIDHSRAPEIFLIMDNDDEATSNGIIGRCLYNGAYPEGGGTHGGLHAKEMHMVMAAKGTAFKAGFETVHPVGIIDVAPTILDCLGLIRPPTMDGRVLVESLNNSDVEPPPAETRTHKVNSGTRVQHLTSTRVGSTTYLDAGWVE